MLMVALLHSTRSVRIVADHRSPKDLVCDYLAYAFLPLARCYVLPFQQLRLRWQKYRREWVQQYGPPIEAQNEEYVSVSVAVPISVLLSTLTNMLVVSWTGKEQPTAFTRASL